MSTFIILRHVKSKSRTGPQFSTYNIYWIVNVKTNISYARVAGNYKITIDSTYSLRDLLYRDVYGKKIWVQYKRKYTHADLIAKFPEFLNL